jgi:ferric-dicitrate binding protein FerR (iron transport regulator)
MVLGTHFNISAYTGEPQVRTTLLEGRIRVTGVAEATRQDVNPVVLKPGEQSLFVNNRITISKVDTGAVIDWKNELFIFDQDRLEGIMKKIERWYDVEAVYLDQNVKREVFSGRISRFRNVGELLNKLSQTGAVNFKIEGRRILITK